MDNLKLHIKQYVEIAVPGDSLHGSKKESSKVKGKGQEKSGCQKEDR
jgi:hypothetical protein